MGTSALLEREAEVDPVEEMRLRTWARRNYLPQNQRDTEMHPVVLDEMRRKDREKKH
jgi:hypothetical protein